MLNREAQRSLLPTETLPDPTLLLQPDPGNSTPTPGEQNSGERYSSVDQLEARALQLATQHLITQHVSSEPHLLARLPQLAIQLQKIYDAFVQAPTITPVIIPTTTSASTLATPQPINHTQAWEDAAEWVLDNFYLLDQTQQEIVHDLPVAYYRQLPKVATSPDLAGYPRVFLLAQAFVSVTNCQFHADLLARFVGAYQQSQPLTIGELWAIPIMLRFALLESLIQAATQIADPSTEATRLLTTDSLTTDSLTTDLPTTTDNEIIANTIPSLRKINSQNWNEFFEQVSLTQKVLCADPAGLYASMDFTTRNRYRGEIERLARGSAKEESVIAQTALVLAQAAHQRSLAGAESERHTTSSTDITANLALPRTSHIGYYLLDKGQPQLEEQIGMHRGWGEALRHWLLTHPTLIYLGSVALLTTTFVTLSLGYALRADSTLWLTVVAGLLALIPGITLAVDVVNWLVTRTLPPRTLPKLDFSDGIPATCRTMIVVPCLIASESDVESLINQMEIHYLRNPDPHLHFALLSDFADAPQAEMPEDQTLLASVCAGIEALNQKYPHQPFYLFHRHRLWNPAEGAWIGWERKRGKLHEFNRRLRTPLNQNPDTSHSVVLGDASIFAQIRYVITLDADTVLPRTQAQRLIGALAHPLNQAQFDPQSGRVVAGYTVLQPRAEIKPTSANQSLFTRVFAGDVGIDLYSRAVSDVYQDLFATGIYVGKGIYEVDSFERSLIGRVPENTLLSHDLFEGIQGRVGLVTDIVLYEEYPPHYLINIQRSHRWIRGDWQLLPWLLPSWSQKSEVRSQKPEIENHESLVSGLQSPISNLQSLALIDRWKIADNLRRSLRAPALLLLLLAGWSILPGQALIWTLLASLIPVFSIVSGAFTGMLSAVDRTTTVTWRSLIRPLRDNGLRWLLFLAFLPHESLIALDAIGRTLVRLLITRRKLLQWTTAANTVRLFGENANAGTTLRKMLPSILAVIGLALFVVAINPTALLVATPFFLLWLSSSQIAYWISRPTDYSRSGHALTGEGSTTPDLLSDTQRRQLRSLACRTWLFYEHFVGSDDNWLPPDHFQEAPRATVAHRTSPTNIGLYLLSLLSAHDLGYLSLGNMLARLEFAFATLDKLERYRGHVLNWIDTHTLASLPPRYVSTVDSGNLAGCLIVLKQGCAALPQQPIWDWERWQGVLDFLGLLADAAEKVDPTDQSLLSSYLQTMQQQIYAVRDDPSQWWPLLTRFTQEGAQELNRHLVEAIEARTTPLDPTVMGDCRIAIERIHQRLHNLQREVEQLHPWLPLLQQPPALFSTADATSIYGTAWQTLTAALPVTPRLEELPAIYAAGQSALVQLEMLLVAVPENPALTQVFGHRVVGRWGDGEIGVIPPTSPQSAQLTLAHDWFTQLATRLGEAESAAQSLIESCTGMVEQSATQIAMMEFGFLFDPQRQVFHIGYNIDSGRLDANFYDLLASEARIASIVAIAKDDVPYSHWLQLGRPLTRLDSGEQVLLSWSGTMFEYLMPPLLMRTYPETLLQQSYSACIQRQIDYGKTHDVPWGISESGFHTFDAAMNYQYHAFGVPGLGFQRGLEEDLVIAPYASLMALPFAPQAVLANLEHLQRLGLAGRYGLYEAVDFTPAHLPLGDKHAIVRSYMAHHQGMILLAVAHYLQGPKMVERFHAEPAIQSVELLLQEQIPRHALIQYPHEAEFSPVRTAARLPTVQPWRVALDTPMPLVHLLSNGRYSLLLTNSGSGYSRWGEIALTRWRADTTLDDWGSWLYVQEMEIPNPPLAGEGSDGDVTVPSLPERGIGWGAPWSIGRQPTGSWGDHQEVTFHPHMVELRRREKELTLHMAITVAPDEDIEIRRIHLSNDSDQPRRVRLTTYGEVVLALPAADQRHPAFSKLFVESDYVSASNALIYHRRPRSAEDKPIYLAHMLVLEPDQTGSIGAGSIGAGSIGAGSIGAGIGKRTQQTSRAYFLGRGRSPVRPIALDAELCDEATEGSEQQSVISATLDPIFSLGQEIELAPRSTIRLATITAVAASRSELLGLIGRYQNHSAIDRTFDRARATAEQELRQVDLQEAPLELIQQLLSLLLYPQHALRAEPTILASNRWGQSGLWGFGISGDHPILLLQMGEESESELLHTLLQAHTYWRRRALKIDLVILNQHESDYGQSFTDFIQRTIRRSDSTPWINQRGGIFLLRQDQLNQEARVLLRSAARVLLDGEKGTLAQQVASILQQPMMLPAFTPTRTVSTHRGELDEPIARPSDLQFDNGLGGFSADGREYMIYLRPGQSTPAPWINVIANPNFGFLISESGAGYTWAGNSGENRLTPWRNDPVSDRPGEAIYLRDEESGEIWSPTPQPAPADTPYLVRHGAGYSTFEHNSHQINHHLRLFAACDPSEPAGGAPIKIVQLRLENGSEGQRRITVTYYAEWVLGVERELSQAYVVSEYAGEVHALLARNAFSPEFGERVAFLAASKAPHSLTADRAEFLGHAPSGLQRPAGLTRIGLSGRVEAGSDPCAALQLHIDLPAGASEEIYFLIGQGANREDALHLIHSFHATGAVESAWQTMNKSWDQVLEAVTVTTPDPAMNLLLNRWLLYQTLACRIWGRSALYQSSGAYGFRDQLQDVLALLHARPDLARQQILRAARRQFEAGDVLHWWHPAKHEDEAAAGVRTRFSDDLLWLPYVTAHYVATTGDRTILNERVPFLQAELLKPDEEERYMRYESAPDAHTLYEHCRRALSKGVTAGVHGLPLMGAGDWNDGMNRVGIAGKGESIWLGWFLHATLRNFASLCDTITANEQAVRYRQQAESIRQAIEAHGWDGSWYRRAYYDDGTPLGSAQNREAQIDAIAQSWAVLSGAGDPARARMAMQAVRQRLVKLDDQLLLLFTPPFDKSAHDPGYIKGYLPGIRENGGQYTHAALWTIWAFAQLGEGDLAEQLFRLINPIYHADSPEKVEHYKIEPYVVAADVYAVAPHVGRGGWSWYTGSSGWMHRLGLEAILGLRRSADTLWFDPCIPAHWPGYTLTYRYAATTYTVQVENPRRVNRGVERVTLDGEIIASGVIRLVDDGKKHQVLIRMGSK